jgi:hypothetical protein
MVAATTDGLQRTEQYPQEDGWDRAELARRQRPSGSLLPSWWVLGLAALGVGALAWYYLGPDLQRYLKMRSM